MLTKHFGTAFFATVALAGVMIQGSPLRRTDIVSGVHTGDGTFYEPGLGACGTTNTASQLIAAMGHGYFDNYPGATADPNKNPICGRKVKATYKGKSVTVAIEDRCAGCAGADDLDFSPTAFSALANPSVGRLTGVTWEFV